MRDIRCDLQERANVVEEQIRAIYAHFEKVVQQLQGERDARVAEFRGNIWFLISAGLAIDVDLPKGGCRKPAANRLL